MAKTNMNLIQRIGLNLAFGKRSAQLYLSNPTGWADIFGTKSKTGVTVNETKALQMSAVFACVRVISETIASLPYHTYERLTRGKQKAINHPVYNLLKDRANPEMTSYTWRQVTAAHAAIWGNAYSEIEYNEAGYPVALWPLLPWKMKIQRNQTTKDLEYVYTRPDGTPKVFSRWQIWHLKPLSMDGLTGISPIAYAKESIGLGLAMEEFGALYFGNGTNLGGFIQTDQKIGDETYKRLKKDMNEKYEGLSNSHRLIILEQGLKYEKAGIPPQDSQFLESRKFQALEIARIFRVPPHMIGDLERATFSNIEEQGINFVTYTLRPWIVNIEQESNTKLFTSTEQSRYFTEMLVDALLRGNIQTRYAAYAVARQNGWMSINDIRELENMNPIEGGDDYMVPLNMIPSSKVDEYYTQVILKGGSNASNKQ